MRSRSAARRSSPRQSWRPPQRRPSCANTAGIRPHLRGGELIALNRLNSTVMGLVSGEGRASAPPSLSLGRYMVIDGAGCTNGGYFISRVSHRLDSELWYSNHVEVKR